MKCTRSRRVIIPARRRGNQAGRSLTHDVPPSLPSNDASRRCSIFPLASPQWESDFCPGVRGNGSRRPVWSRRRALSCPPSRGRRQLQLPSRALGDPDRRERHRRLLVRIFFQPPLGGRAAPPELELPSGAAKARARKHAPWPS